MSHFVVAYDVGDDRARQKVAEILARYGRRVQRSVFEILAEPRELDGLLNELGPWLASDDALDLFPLDTRRWEQRIAWHRPPYPHSTVSIVGSPLLPHP